MRDLEKAAELDNDEDNAREYKQKIREAKVELKRAGREDLYKVSGTAPAVAGALEVLTRAHHPLRLRRCR